MPPLASAQVPAFSQFLRGKLSHARDRHAAIDPVASPLATKVHRFRCSKPGRLGVFHQLYDTQRNRGQGERTTIDR